MSEQKNKVLDITGTKELWDAVKEYVAQHPGSETIAPPLTVSEIYKIMGVN